MDRPLPEITANSELSDAIRSVCDGPQGLPELEREACETTSVAVPFFASDAWETFCQTVLQLWRERDHVIVRGLPALAEGASLLLASLCLAGPFKTYRNGRIVKTFRMSPWTTDLSHTTREGDFHTDINTDPEPPAVTAIQCLTPDPGAPRYGVNRVARAADLLAYLEANGSEDVLRFLCETPVTMVNDRSQDAWTAPIVQDDRIRFHPETIRAATRRFEIQVPEIEEHLAAIHAAALAVSAPFELNAGDILFVSNHRALHYRGECSVAFIDFPLEFRSRAIHVLHKMSEPQ
ncbi:MAG TPA: TauD/TfdA family dioxygenase [Thermoanaerobaculia bacterium]|nr:TauD/TfdA family dioxygenase [Thermoanaerobaculia bacterium]